tara:strand:- start:8125 stop:10929 length:2805 start_codon:yes stop_codon:yes gene_type:complete
MKLILVALFVFFHTCSASLVSNIKCSQIDYIYQDSDCCQSGTNSARCLKQIAQADLDAELDSLNTKIDNLQHGGMTVQQNAVLQVGSNAQGVGVKTGTLRVESAGTIEVMDGGKIDIKTGGVLDVSGATVLGLGGSSSGDAVAVGYMTLHGIEGDTTVSGEFSINGGLKMDYDKVVIEDNTGNIDTKGSLVVGGSIDASSLNIDTDKFNLDVSGNINSKGNIITSGDFKLKNSNGAVTVSIDSETGSMTADGYSFIKGDLYVDGSAQLRNGINVDNKFTVADSSGDTTILGKLSVAAETALNGGVLLNSNVQLAAGTTFTVLGTVDVSRGTLIGEYVTATNADISQLTGTLDHQNHAHSNVNLASGVINNIAIGGTGAAAGTFLSLAATDVTASALVTASAGLTVTGAATFNTGATITGAVDGITTLSASGRITATAGFTSAGDVNINIVRASGLANLDGGVAVDTDKLTIDATGNMASKGSVTVDGKVTAAGSDLVGSGLRVAATDLASDVNFEVDHSTGNVNTEGTLTVAQGSTLTGNVAMNGTLDVIGISSLDGGINVADNFNVAADTGKVDSSDGFYAQKSSSLKGLIVQADNTQGLTVDGVVSKLDGGISVSEDVTTTGFASHPIQGFRRTATDSKDCTGSDAATLEASEITCCQTFAEETANIVGFFIYNSGWCDVYDQAAMDGTQATNSGGTLYSIQTVTTNVEKYTVGVDGSMTAKGLSTLDGGVAISDKFSVNVQGHASASGLTVAGSRLPKFQEREDVDCSGFVEDASPSKATAGNGVVIVLAKGTCAKKFERYVCGSALDGGVDNVVSEAEFENHETISICTGGLYVDLVDTCTTHTTCGTGDCDDLTGSGAPGGSMVVGGQYCRNLDSRERCEGNNLFGDSGPVGSSGTYDGVSDVLRTPLVWTAASLEMHMCLSTSTSIKN